MMNESRPPAQRNDTASPAQERAGNPARRILWTPSAERRQASNLRRFADFVSRRLGTDFPDYESLHRWSVEEPAGFWKAVWDFCGVVHGGNVLSVLEEPRLPGARWFRGAELSFSENLLRHRGSRPALISAGEDEKFRAAISFDELADQVARLRSGLLRLGVAPGDRVAAFTPNQPEAVAALLAASSLGAVWSSCSPDFGVQGVVDRFGQIGPKVLFAATACLYGGKRHPLGERLKAILERLPSIESTVLYPGPGGVEESVSGLRGQISYADLLAGGRGSPGDVHHRFPFDHPLAILYTSGTTGMPKCIVHGAGGTLLKHLEEHALQVDLKEGDVFFYYTTTGWMMWNWLVSGLASGATVVLYDGSPLQPDPGRLFRLIDREGITVFGASPRFLSAVEDSGLEPRRVSSLPSLRTMLSTGSPLHPHQFEWVYRSVKEDLQLASISGGTDLIGCFVLGSPFHPVRSGEIQCRALGMDVESLDEEGRPVVGRKGELVCSTPFPSMPLRFWNDPEGKKYRAAYFERYPGKWHHGDFIEITAEGGAVIYGRSDATLNPGGVRIGTAEIYRAVERLPEVREALAVGREAEGDVRIVLFLVLAPGAELDEALRGRIRAAIRESTSPRHVPAEIHAIAEVPRTVSGKTVELAVARLLRGEEPGNREALANPESLEQFRRFAPAAARTRGESSCNP
jgi:acetoacetyl-CoA synthetase